MNINSNDLEDILAHALASIKQKIPGTLLFQDTRVQLTIIFKRTSRILKLYLKNFKKLVIQEAEPLSNDILLHIKICSSTKKDCKSTRKQRQKISYRSW